MYGRAIENLGDNVEPILNLYTNRVDDLVDSSDDNGIEENIWFCLNNKVYFCKQ